MNSLWWWYFNHAMETYGYHHWEAELYAYEKTGGGGFSTLSLAPRDCPSIAESCYISREEVKKKKKKE